VPTIAGHGIVIESGFVRDRFTSRQWSAWQPLITTARSPLCATHR
jgi:hypothetical protein